MGILGDAHTELWFLRDDLDGGDHVLTCRTHDVLFTVTGILVDFLLQVRETMFGIQLEGQLGVLGEEVTTDRAYEGDERSEVL